MLLIPKVFVLLQIIWKQLSLKTIYLKLGHLKKMALCCWLRKPHGEVWLINQLKLIIYYGEFHPVEGETNIFSAISEQSDDFDNLINAARKAVEHGYRVYILPNPRSCRTADFIFEKKGILGLYDLKTVHGKGSVGTQLLDSIGQTNRVILNMTTNYNARLLSSEIKAYFEANEQAVEVLIFKGKKSISISRWQVEAPRFNRLFRKKYEK